jgi:hypothetical protein
MKFTSFKVSMFFIRNLKLEIPSDSEDEFYNAVSNAAC